MFSKIHPIKEEITNQKSTKSHTETIAAPRVEKSPLKLDNIHQQPIEEHVSAPRVNVSKENTAPLETQSPVPVPHIIEVDIKTIPEPTPIPCNIKNYTKQVTPHIIPDDRPRYRYNTRYTRGYAQAIQKITNDEDLSNENRTTSYDGYINHVVHPVTGKIVHTHN